VREMAFAEKSDMKLLLLSNPAYERGWVDKSLHLQAERL
jgi:hypothetical protein